MNTLIKSRIASKSFAALAAVTAAVALPQIFHLLGAASGFGALPGATFLPIHIPVLIAALLAGPVVGVTAGIFSPLMSFLYTSAVGTAIMPMSALLPFMTVELAGYGLVAGLLNKREMPVLGKLLIAQLGGRLLRAIAVLIAVYALENGTVGVDTIWNTVKIGLPGIVLQWALIPLIIYRAKGAAKGVKK